MTKILEFRIPGRAPSKKNSRRVLRGGKNIPSAAYQSWYEPAAYELKAQFKALGLGKDPLDGLYTVVVIQLRKNRQHATDVDAPLTTALDLMKGIVLEDDSPKYVRAAMTETVFGCKEDMLVIQLHPYPKEGCAICSTQGSLKAGMLEG